jgi:5-methylcytosine-specific restriction endonuclease McrA
VTSGFVPEQVLQQLAGQSRHSTRAPLVRLAVRARAGDACEYCLLPTIGQFNVDHIIPPGLWQAYIAGRIRGVPPTPGRGGPDHLDNYAWSCATCNSAKGRQVLRRIGRRTHRLYDPRQDRWSDHFGYIRRYLLIVSFTAVGAATIEALGMNGSGLDGPLGPRHEAILQGIYPPPWARNTLTDPG